MGVEFVRDERDKKAPDTLGITGRDPNKAYRWLRKQDTNIAMAEHRGWEINRGGKERSVLSPHSGVQRKGTDVDSTVSVGDLVLASMPRERYEQLQKENQDRIRRRTAGAASQFHSSAVDPIRGERLSYEEHKDAGGYRESVTAEQYERMQREGKK